MGSRIHSGHKIIIMYTCTMFVVAGLHVVHLLSLNRQVSLYNGSLSCFYIGIVQPAAVDFLQLIFKQNTACTFWVIFKQEEKIQCLIGKYQAIQICQVLVVDFKENRNLPSLSCWF